MFKNGDRDHEKGEQKNFSNHMIVCHRDLDFVSINGTKRFVNCLFFQSATFATNDQPRLYYQKVITVNFASHAIFLHQGKESRNASSSRQET